MECVICLDAIICNDYYKFNCCNNCVHSSCLKTWVVKNINNKDISKCFICSQKNYAIENIILHHCYNNDEINNSNDSNNNNNSNDSNNSNNNNNNDSNDSNNSNNSNINNNNTNYIIIDISAARRQLQPYIESKPFFFLKIIYCISVFSILLLGFIYIY